MFIIKIFKYILSIVRKIKFKILFGNKIKIDEIIKISKKSVYLGKGNKILLNKKSKLVINKGAYISDYCKLECIDGYIEIGKETFINDYCKIISLKKIKIGDNCLLGPNVSIYDHNHEYRDRSIRIKKQGFNTANIKIGNDVWIGANVTITSGVEIGDRVIVGANSVVTKNLEPNSIYAGIPAIKIKEI